MDKYQFKDINRIFVTGNCHGEIKSLFNSIKHMLSIRKEDEEEIHPMEIERQARKKAKEEAHMRLQMNRPRLRARFEEPIPVNMSSSGKIKMYFEQYNRTLNTILFVTGDCGFGINKEQYYIDLLERYNKILSYNNMYIIFVRGNHDDPSYFDGKRINFSNIKAVPDYSIVEAKDKVVLCVGGAISTDRSWRIEQEKRINGFKQSNLKTLYWSNEAPVLDKEKMDEIFGEYNKIDYVISHTAPSFTNPIEYSCVQEWEKNDESLKKDISDERITMDRIFEYLRDNDRKPIYWAYGHFDISFMEFRSGTWFMSLCGDFNNIDIEQYLSLSISENTIKNSRKKKAKKPNKQSIQTMNPWGDDEADTFYGAPQELENTQVQETEEVGDTAINQVIDTEALYGNVTLDTAYTINHQPFFTRVQPYANTLNDTENQRRTEELREQMQQAINRLQGTNGIFTTAFTQDADDGIVGEITHATNNG